LQAKAKKTTNMFYYSGVDRSAALAAQDEMQKGKEGILCQGMAEFKIASSSIDAT
jgi:hypothetical protein